jgi:hypothetical protein
MSKRKQSTPRPPRTRNRFRERELARAVRAAKAAGGAAVSVDPTTGKITVIVGKPSEEGGGNPWDEVLTGTAGQNRPV